MENKSCGQNRMGICREENLNGCSAKEDVTLIISAITKFSFLFIILTYSSQQSFVITLCCS